MKKYTKKEKELLMNLVKATPAWFAYFATEGKFRYPRHIRVLNKLLFDISSRKIKRLIVNMPPRHGKSELISRYYPVWYLGTFPSHRVILACYGASLAETFGRKVKNILTEFGGSIFNIQINPSSKSAKRFDLQKHEGGMDFVGADGAITGKGANLFIIDDPVKNDAESNSLNMREKLWDWFNATAMTRLEPDGILIIVMTRWHEDDLCGRIIANNEIVTLDEYLRNDCNLNNEPWILAKLSAIATEEDCLGRKKGDALWEKRYSEKQLKNIEKNSGSYRYAALYQQTPAPANGNIFKRNFFRYFTEDDDFYYLKPILQDFETKKTVAKSECPVYAVVDLAVTKKETSDYTVIIIFMLTGKKDILIREVIREKFEGSEHTGLIRNINEIWHPSIIGIESVQYQLSLIQTLREKGFAIKELKPEKDKFTRALTMKSRLEAGKIFLFEKALWLNDFEEELMMFPNAAHDDQVDAFAYISKMVTDISTEAPKSASVKQNKIKITSGFLNT